MMKYNKIFNPNLNKWENVNSKSGKELIKKYLKYTKGAYLKKSIIPNIIKEINEIFDHAIDKKVSIEDLHIHLKDINNKGNELEKEIYKLQNKNLVQLLGDFNYPKSLYRKKKIINNKILHLNKLSEAKKILKIK